MHFDELSQPFVRWVIQADTATLRAFLNYLNQLDLSAYPWQKLLTISEMIAAIEFELFDRGDP